MAILLPNGKIKVEYGDTLSEIAEDFCGGASKTEYLGTLNGITDLDMITVDQELITSPTESKPTPTVTNTTVSVTQFGEITTSPGTLYIAWNWSKLKETDNFKVEWTYDTGDGIWFVGEDDSVKVDPDDPTSCRMQATYSIPTSANKVRVRVKPMSRKKETSNGKNDEVYWTVLWTNANDHTWYRDKAAPTVPGIPKVEIKALKLTASLDNINIDGATHIEFQVCKDNEAKAYATNKSEIVSAHAACEFKVGAGGEYKVRARSYSSKLTKYSDWSNYSDNKETIPAVVSKINTIRADSETSVYLDWTASSAATSYEIEYATKEEYFDTAGSSDVKKDTTEFPKRIISGLESGMEYFFRVRAVNSAGSSEWSTINSVVIGAKPGAPTTWSSTTTVVTGEPLILYWMHNSRDGSSETWADLKVLVNGVRIEPKEPIPKSESEDEKDLPSSYVLDTSSYAEGVQIQWQVRTAGVFGSNGKKQYGDWSTQRTVTVYAQPTLQLNVLDNNGNDIETLTSFPFKVYALAGPNTQTPIGYYLTVTSGSTYETTDNKGNTITINIGDVVYSKYFDPPADSTSSALEVALSANNIDLESGVDYTITCAVSMNSGLTVDASRTITVEWEDALYAPNAKIAMNADNLTTTIIPYCENSWTAYYKVNYTNYRYIKTDEDLVQVYGKRVNGCTTTTGEAVYSGTAWTGDTVYYCVVEEKSPITDVYLAIYRREFDGCLTELASGLDGEKSTTITDPHPPLDLARYRIVAVSKSTGAVSYTDLPGYPVGATCVIIQWDEDWIPYDVTEDAEMVEPAWTGSLLKLPYNIDVSDNNKSDVTLVKYIGREHPVSYYGTQLGQSSTWNMEIPKSDKETIYALRRLSSWMGDVYVREPSGTGYWANISVSFNLKHRSMTVPVTLDITRVEGGA